MIFTKVIINYSIHRSLLPQKIAVFRKRNMKKIAKIQLSIELLEVFDSRSNIPA
jgi:hypothetical protein